MNNRREFLTTLGVITAMPLLGFCREARSSKAKAFRVLSCNIRVALEEDETKGVGWSHRKDICLRIIKKRKPDIICLQEVLKIQANDFKNYFKGFQLIGFDGPEMDMYAEGYHGIAKNPILFSTEKYELIGAGVYWLSDSPLIAGSKSWDTARARNANWVRLKEKSTGKEFRVINLHLDHISEKARMAQISLVMEESRQYPAEFTQILAGDFNSNFNSEVLNKVRVEGWKDSFEAIHGIKEAGFTGHAFKGLDYEKGAKAGRIDFIWYMGKIEPKSFEIIRDNISGIYPSDHFFVQSDFEIN